MYIPPVWQINQERHKELLKIAQERQLIGQNRTEVVSRKDRLFMNLGDLLITLGSRVKARYEPATR
jgi:hypothetical protein